MSQGATCAGTDLRLDRPCATLAPVPGNALVLIAVGFLASGLAGLVHQVVWSRYLGLFIGSTSAAVTIVLAAFMGGLALGNHLFGRSADRSARPLALYAWLELGIGLYCVAFPELFGWLSDGYVAAAQNTGFGTTATFALKLLMAALAILPPTILMGGTMPVLAKAVVRSVREVTVGVGRLYFFNSGGAALGAAIAGFWWVPSLGLDGAIRLAGVLNLVLAALFFAAARRRGAATPADDAPPTGDEAATDTQGVQAPVPDEDDGAAFSHRQVKVAVLAIGLSGAASMLYEVLWSRLLALVMGSSTYSFTIMLVTFITGITLGSLAVSAAFRAEPSRDPVRWFAVCEVAIFASLLPLLPLYDDLPFYFAQIASLLDRTQEGFGGYLAIKVVVAFVLMFLPTFFIGMTLPLASRIATKRMSHLGRSVGLVFSVNTVGTVLGAVLTGLVIMPAIGLEATFIVGLLLSLGIASLLLSIVSDLSRRVRLGVPIVGILALTVVVGVGGGWDPLILNFGLFRHKEFGHGSIEELRKQLEPFQVVEAEAGADTSVAILRDTRTDRIYMKVNGKTDAGTGGDMTTQLWLGHLGMLLQPDAKDALVIGLGSGITAGAVAQHPDARVDVVEISKAVVRGARFFSAYNNDVLNDEAVTLHVGDAKEFFKLHPDRRWDVVVSEPSNPWISGIGNLFSSEYFEEIRDHLAPGGVLVQWVHLYELDDRLLRIILNTVTAEFAHVELWQCNTEDMLVVASSQPIAFQPEKVAQRLALDAVRQDLNRPHLPHTIEAPVDVALLQMASSESVRTYFPGEPPFNRDTHPILEYEAPAAFFANATATLPWHIDDRRYPVETSPLHIAGLDAVANAQLDDATLERIANNLGARGSVPDAALLTSLAWRVWSLRHERRSAAAWPRALVKQFADARTRRTLSSAGRVAPPMQLQAQLRVMHEGASVLFTPPTEGLTELSASMFPQRPVTAPAGPAALMNAALGRMADPRLLQTYSLTSPGAVPDPDKRVGGGERVPVAVLYAVLEAEAWRREGRPECARDRLRLVADDWRQRFPIRQLLSHAERTWSAKSSKPSTPSTRCSLPTPP